MPKGVVHIAAAALWTNCCTQLPMSHMHQICLLILWAMQVRGDAVPRVVPSLAGVLILSDLHAHRREIRRHSRDSPSLALPGQRTIRRTSRTACV